MEKSIEQITKEISNSEEFIQVKALLDCNITVKPSKVIMIVEEFRLTEAIKITFEGNVNPIHTIESHKNFSDAINYIVDLKISYTATPFKIYFKNLNIKPTLDLNQDLDIELLVFNSVLAKVELAFNKVILDNSTIERIDFHNGMNTTKNEPIKIFSNHPRSCIKTLSIQRNKYHEVDVELKNLSLEKIYIRDGKNIVPDFSNVTLKKLNYKMDISDKDIYYPTLANLSQLNLVGELNEAVYFNYYYLKNSSKLKTIIYNFHNGYENIFIPTIFSILIFYASMFLIEQNLEVKNPALNFLFPNKFIENVLISDFSTNNSISYIKVCLLGLQSTFAFSLFCIFKGMKKKLGFKIE